MPSIRYVHLFVMVFSMVGPLCDCAECFADSYGIKQLEHDRLAAAHRSRRIIFNNDGNSIVYHLEETTAEALLAARTTPLVSTQVDSIFYSSWNSGFGHCTHISSVAEAFVAKTGPFKANRTGEFHAKGLDPLEIMVDFGKAKGIEIFWSMRMNDIHDAFPQWSELLPRFKKAHPELMFSTRDKRPAIGYWSGLDYRHEAVRARAFALLEDVCKRYDVDGIEMDFLRHPPHFQSHSQGKVCTREECDLMTGLVRKFRKMSEREGLRRRRPILVCVRLPASADCCKAMGLDVVRWMEEGLVDLVVPGEWEFEPWEDWVQLGHRHGVMVYPCLNLSVQRGRSTKSAPDRKLPILRARAVNAWQSGADGVYTYNFFDPHSPAWREIGSRKTLAGLDKDYYVNAYAPAMIEKYMNGHKRFMKGSCLHPECPIKLEPEKPRSVELSVGEDLAGASKAPGSLPVVTLRLRIGNVGDAKDLSISLNGNALTDGDIADGWFVYKVPVSVVKRGENVVKLCYHGSDAKAILKDMLLRITYGKDK